MYLCTAFCVRLIVSSGRWHDLVAQSVEHLTFNQGVMGSSPIEITKYPACEQLAGYFFCHADSCLPVHRLQARFRVRYWIVVGRGVGASLCY